MRNVDAAYLAGIVDGEGHIGLVRQPGGTRGYKADSWQPRVRVSTTTPTLTDWLQVHSPGTVHSRKATDTYRELLTWQVLGAGRVGQLLTTLLPYLVVKSEHAEVVLAYCRTVKNVGGRGHDESTVRLRRELADRLTVLNRRGA